MNLSHSLPEILLQPHVQAALLEDLGRRGDVTSEAMIDESQQAQLHIVSRESGIVCGMALAKLAFEAMQADMVFDAHVQDGDVLEAGMVLARVAGNARAILAAERTALNFLTHLSGIATTTHGIVQTIAPTKAQLTCTRKTIPGMRMLQKYAVRVGGGRNHRMGLDDAILIKDNHIALAGGDLKLAIQKAKAYAGHLLAVEVEVDTLAQLALVLEEGVGLVLLDNMTVPQLAQAVAMCQGQCQTEASGGLTPEKALAVAQTGVDFLAMGYVTHSARYLDIGLDYRM